MSRVAQGEMGPPVPAGVDLTFDSTADPLTQSLPLSAPIVSGTFAPTSYNPNPVLDTSALPPPYGSDLKVLNGTSPNGSWSLYVQDDAPHNVGAITNGWTINFVTDAPTIQFVGPQSVLENGSLAVKFHVGSNLGDSATNLLVAATPSLENPAGLLTKGTLSTVGPDTNGLVTLTLTPALNLPSAAPGWTVGANGTALITLTVAEVTNVSFVNSFSFPLTVTYSNQPPFFAGLANTNTAANAPITIAFTAGDVDTPAKSLNVGIQGITDNTGSSITLSNVGNNAFLTLNPNGVAGSASVIVTNFDPISQMTATGHVIITVTAPTAPTIDPINSSNVVHVAVNTALSLTLGVHDPSVPDVSTLSYTVTGLPANLAGINFKPVNGQITMNILALSLVGNAAVTVTATDSYGVAGSQTFTLYVDPPVPPVLAQIKSVTVAKDQPVPVTLGITTNGTPLSGMDVSYAVVQPANATVAISPTNKALAVVTPTSRLPGQCQHHRDGDRPLYAGLQDVPGDLDRTRPADLLRHHCPAVPCGRCQREPGPADPAWRHPACLADDHGDAGRHHHRHHHRLGR